jgi:hypothetical protein
MHVIIIRRVWRYQRGNHNPYIEEEQTTQWPREKGQKNKQRSSKYTYKTKDRVTRTPLTTGVNSGAPEGWAVNIWISCVCSGRWLFVLLILLELLIITFYTFCSLYLFLRWQPTHPPICLLTCFCYLFIHVYV